MNELDEIYKFGITQILENDGYVYKYVNEKTVLKILENESHTIAEMQSSYEC